MKKQKKLFDVLIFLFLTAGSFFMLYPFIWMIFTSFKPKMHIYLGGLLPQVWDFSSYVQIWMEIPLVRGFLNTILYSVPPVLVGSLVSVAAAFAFAKIYFKGKNLIFLLLLSAIMVPFPTIMIPQFVLFSELKLLATPWPPMRSCGSSAPGMTIWPPPSSSRMRFGSPQPSWSPNSMNSMPSTHTCPASWPDRSCCWFRF